MTRKVENSDNYMELPRTGAKAQAPKTGSLGAHKVTFNSLVDAFIEKVSDVWNWIFNDSETETPTITQKKEYGLSIDIYSFIKKGDENLSTGKFDDAIGEYSKAILTDPTYGLAFLSRGEAFLAKGEIKEALADFLQALKLNNSGPTAKSILGRLEEQGFTFDKLKEKFPSSNPQIENLKKEVVEAIAETGIQTAPRINNEVIPEKSFVLKLEGDKAQSNGNVDLAIFYFTEAIAADRNYLGASISRGQAYLSKGQIKEALTDFTSVLKIRPNIPFANSILLRLADLGASFDEIKQKLGGDQGAITQLEELEALVKKTVAQPRLEELFMSGAEAFLNGEDAKAIEIFDAVIAENPRHRIALFYRGEAKLASGNIKGAIEDFQEGLKLSPQTEQRSIGNLNRMKLTTLLKAYGLIAKEKGPISDEDLNLLKSNDLVIKLEQKIERKSRWV